MCIYFLAPSVYTILFLIIYFPTYFSSAEPSSGETRYNRRNTHGKTYIYISLVKCVRTLARPGRKQARKHARDARNFNKIEKPAVIKFLFLQGKASKGIHAILAETLAFFLPGRAKDLSAPLCNPPPH